MRVVLFEFKGVMAWCFTTLSTIFQLFQFSFEEETRIPRENHRPVASH